MRPARRRRGYHGNDAAESSGISPPPSFAAPSVIPLKITDFWLPARRRWSERGRRRPSAHYNNNNNIVYCSPRRRAAGRLRSQHKRVVDGGGRGRERTVYSERGLYRRALFGFPDPQNRGTGFRRARRGGPHRHPLSTFTRIPKHYARTHPRDTTCSIRRHTGRALCPASSRRHRRRGITAGRDVVTAAAAASAAGPFPTSRHDDEPAWIFN